MKCKDCKDDICDSCWTIWETEAAGWDESYTHRQTSLEEFA